MKNFILTSILGFILLAFTGCSKDFLKSYERRILGTWDLVNIDKRGIGGGSIGNRLPFQEGVYTFKNDGELIYINESGSELIGAWNIIRKNSGYTNSNGVRVKNDERMLKLTAINFNDPQVKEEYFNEMQFTSTNRFKAVIQFNGFRYVYIFKRR